ncbi:FMN-binding protein [Kitasatospora sp. NPDC088346]|uniref:FMN-binding protein n=1 Tax=Kitasatospora sp. NPDC088346 TaxID=3364073 RepID=UPI003802707E
MRRAVVTVTATAAGVILLLSLKPHGSTPVAAIGSGGTAADNSGGSTSSSTAGSAGQGGATDTSTATRSVTGSAVGTRYGPVQVKVTLAGSRITAVDVIQYPSGDHRDQEINSYALPVLNQEAIAAQSAGIDVVSGATYTSDGYIRSLQSALDRAGR